MSLQRFTEQGARITRVCLTRHVPLSGFRPSQRFPSPRSSRVFFTPERSWDSPFRAFPSRRAVAPLGARYPLVVIASRLPRSTPIFTPSGGKKRSATRLQGLAPFWSPFSRAWRLASAWGRCSLGLLPLQGFPHPLRPAPPRAAPLLCLPLSVSLYQAPYNISYSILAHRTGNTTRLLIQIRPERHTSEFQSTENAVNLSRDLLPS